MKNTIILLLSLLCIFLLLHFLGVFDYGSLIERDHRARLEKSRTEAVGRCKKIKLGALYSRHDQPAVEALRGIELAIELINQQGGVQGKKLALIQRKEINNLVQYNSQLQEFCIRPEIAAVLGPFSSGYIPPARALTQYHGLPLISPLTVISEKIPPLEPDNFVTFFPPLKLWIDAIIAHLDQRNWHELLIISPGSDSYGDIFSTALERSARLRSDFGKIFRINYQPPLSRRELVRSLRNYIGEKKRIAVFFGGTYNDFPELGELLNELKIDYELYGTDDLNVASLKQHTVRGKIFLPRAVLPSHNAEFAQAWRERYQQEPNFNAILGGETILAIARNLQQMPNYTPASLVKNLRDQLKQQLATPKLAPRIVVDEISTKK